MNEECTKIDPDMPCIDEVKSRAVVKYSAPKPATFAKLQCNTDLNLPPSNWLSSAADSYGLQRVLCHQKGFSSFRMAHMFPDCVGEVDVVSDAENIKNLLKIPYCKGHISMMVHRVENTLLLDDFDIYKHLLKTSETEWEWLKKFFFENITPETYEADKHLYIKNRSQKALKQKSLVSKFLYHSLVEGEISGNESGSENSNASPLGSYPLQSPDLPLPDPSPNTECPDNESFDGKYNRNVVWTFEDIEMLLGTDMPIFGGGTHPCISLRLRDMNKPISVLTGIDYWLDNLMSNVPEVVMCYHLNGIVQKYELIKTEDLPRLDNSKFNPKLIRDVAQSILSFLKSNATKAGHTYWLFKANDEEVIKLYDLTSLCSEEDVHGENPFTIPVAMLLYRVARNMKHASDRRHQSGTIRMLLKNCVKLLPKEKYPEIVTSSHYMLSDLYVPAHLNPESPDFQEQINTDDETGSVYDDDDFGDSISVLDLEKCDNDVKFTNCYKPPPPLSGSIEERCLQAVGHVAAGLNCLQYFAEQQNIKDGNVASQNEDEEIPMARPFEAIPMPYGKISEDNTELDKPHHSRPSKKSKKKERKRKSSTASLKEENVIKGALLPKNKNEAQSAWRNFDAGSISWKGHLKTLLFEKAVLVYAMLVEQYFSQSKYGSTLRVLGILARCQLALIRLENAPGVLRLSVLLGRAGDACLMIVNHWKEVDSYREQLMNHQDEDLSLLENLEQDERANRVNLGQSETKCVFIPDLRTIEQMLVKAVECYGVASRIASSENINYRLANSLNELASYYLNVAKQAKSTEDIIDACEKAEPHLNRGLEIFERLNNDANISLLNSNIGHLHRLLAYAYAPDDRGELTILERKHYSKAIQNYKRALRVLGERKSCPGIWDAVTWELSTAMFTVSCIMYDRPPSDVSTQEAQRQTLESLQKALESCDLTEDNPKFPLYQYRAATLHFKIGSLWHGHVWNEGNDNKKHAVQLASLHYEKAVKLFLLSGDAVPYLTVQMQRVALGEFLVEGTGVPSAKLKHLQHCLKVFTEIGEVLQLLMEKKIQVPDDKKEDGAAFKTLYSLLKLVKTRLQHGLKTLVKLCASKPPPHKDSTTLLQLYKNCYKATFTMSDTLGCDDLLAALNKALCDINIIL